MTYPCVCVSGCVVLSVYTCVFVGTGSKSWCWESLSIISHLFFFFKKIFCNFKILSMYVCLCVCTLACVGTWARKWRAEASISWNWRCKQLWVTWMRYWELNSGLLKEQCVFLTSESFQQSPHLFYFILCYWKGSSLPDSGVHWFG